MIKCAMSRGPPRGIAAMASSRQDAYGGLVKVVLSYALAFLGVAMLLVAVAQSFGGMKYPRAKLMIINLLRTNPNGAEVACRTVKGTFFEAIGAAFKTAAMTMSRDPKMIVQATRPAYDAAAMGITTYWKQLLMKAKLAGGMACGGLAIGLMGNNGKTSVLIVVLVVVCLLGIGWLMLRKHEVERTIVLARAEILPELDRAFVEGRYRAG